MAVFSKTIVISDEYGYVVLAAVGHTLLNFWLALNVGKARKQHKIEYPTMYSPDNNEFNCIQRAHQHTLENYPTYLCLLLLGGLEHPRCAAGAGAVYLVSKVAFAKGYYTGDPKNRVWGVFGYITELVLLGSTVSFACRLLGCMWKD